MFRWLIKPNSYRTICYAIVLNSFNFLNSFNSSCQLLYFPHANSFNS